MELKVSHRICAEISETSVLSAKERSGRGDTEAVMRMERCRNYRSRSVSGSYPYARSNTTEDGSMEFYGVPERKAQHDAV